MGAQKFESIDLQGKVALVVGATSGIGWAVASALSGAGASVAVAGRRADRLAELAASLSGPVLPVELDVTDADSVEAAVAATVAEFGHLDVLINNAGVMYIGGVLGGDTAEWERMIRTNLLGNMLVVRAALPHLLSARGTIVQTSSTSGRLSTAGSGAYSATKAGVNAFSEALRQEVTGAGVRVVVIEPGYVTTELVDHITDPAMRAMAAEMQETMTTLQPGDVAAAVLFAVAQPQHVSVSELLIRPTDQLQ
ncbi:SDR family NAD(P)-dependent oxidoreductase [Curtobacterium sp. L1-20]|uniref:SDR family NAD(P)-dependent oxidoreductase n=1 Tax=Curtobacterium sp. L1-20 TaxID=3138181 RepID=UPI003B51C214